MLLILQKLLHSIWSDSDGLCMLVLTKGKLANWNRRFTSDMVLFCDQYLNIVIEKRLASKSFEEMHACVYR